MPTLTIIQENQQHSIIVQQGENLRQVLLANDFSPYTSVTSIANCGGRGLCASCGVWIEEAEPEPEHWHDRLASRFGYPRLSCQITIERDMTVRLLADKFIWGKRDGARARRVDSFRKRRDA
ncbi:MAG: 2Fe-2S iron-sulfur cluster binding domain-containing protein [Anaerolineae bacterium]|nr:2Fe-2S iron-sulfur cluster binding domain-containing protein [Anaerolineae bacterium]